MLSVANAVCVLPTERHQSADTGVFGERRTLRSTLGVKPSALGLPPEEASPQSVMPGYAELEFEPRYAAGSFE